MNYLIADDAINATNGCGELVTIVYNDRNREVEVDTCYSAIISKKFLKSLIAGCAMNIKNNSLYRIVNLDESSKMVIYERDGKYYVRDVDEFNKKFIHVNRKLGEFLDTFNCKVIRVEGRNGTAFVKFATGEVIPVKGFGNINGYYKVVGNEWKFHPDK